MNKCHPLALCAPTPGHTRHLLVSTDNWSVHNFILCGLAGVWMYVLSRSVMAIEAQWGQWGDSSLSLLS